jgi:hypothetical protein
MKKITLTKEEKDIERRLNPDSIKIPHNIKKIREDLKKVAQNTTKSREKSIKTTIPKIQRFFFALTRKNISEEDVRKELASR